jgi:hypothetical protein
MMRKPARRNEAQYSLVDLALGKLTPEQSLEVIDKLEQDPFKSSELELIINILASAEALPAIEDSRNNPKRGYPSGVRERRSDFTLAMRSAAAIVLLLGSVFLSGEFSEAPYASLIRVCAEDMDVRTRGESAEIVEIAYALVLEGDNVRATELVNWCLNAFPEGEESAQAHLLKGGMLLMASKRSVLGFFSHYDTVLAARGLSELHLAFGQTNQRRLKECALWLGVKGNLMVGNKSAALNQIETLELIGGTRQADARRMRDIIEK